MPPALGTASERIREIGQMSTRLPNFRVHRDGRVQTHHVVSKLYVIAPPEFLDIVLVLDTKRAIIPGGAETPVDFTRLKNKTAPFAQRYYPVHVYHFNFLLR